MKTPMKALGELLSRALGASRDLIAAHRELTQEHARLLEERRVLLAAPAPGAEIIAAVEAEVDRRATALAATYGPLLRLVCGFDVAMDGTPSARPAGLPAELDMGPLDFSGLCGLLPSAVKARLREVLEAVDVRHGEPMGARLDLVVALDRDISEVEAEHTRLCDAAAALEPPILLPLLEPVRARRAAQQQQTERLEREARDRKIRA